MTNQYILHKKSMDQDGKIYWSEIDRPLETFSSDFMVGFGELLEGVYRVGAVYTYPKSKIHEEEIH